MSFAFLLLIRKSRCYSIKLIIIRLPEESCDQAHWLSIVRDSYIFLIWIRSKSKKKKVLNSIKSDKFRLSTIHSNPFVCMLHAINFILETRTKKGNKEFVFVCRKASQYKCDDEL